ncbi:competence/damage-inducible protein A [Halobacillus yeomjeoni]|uniref:competence/damage-inducible protein A n=1 Tax=Halobacillus yeomjeoni TaxID=311194 RepID=UPI001CD5A339|nr:competence/damage-inducible protein A [Halobacillus yeomjeoni]MCA0983256.1 competence/damage-inducible protein A [Halobacillus yeomjeoni]
MNAEIIAVGTELLLGQIANTNAQWISQQLAKIGMPVYHHHVVGDNMDRVQDAFQTAERRSEVIIITGGLGPTEDDMTRDAAGMILQQKLIEDPKSMDRISSYYEKNRLPMTENNRKQALVFEHAQVLQNDEGMAPGQIVTHEGTMWVFLPGVPSEMKQLMTEYVLPHLRKTYDLKSEIVSEMMRFIGIGESSLEDELSDLISNQTNPTLAPLAGEGEVGLRITATGESHEEAINNVSEMKKVVLDRVGRFYYGSDEVTIEETVRDLLKRQKLTVGSAESLTGGKFIEAIISLPGASNVCKGALVTYTPEAKQHVLGVPASLIDSYGTISAECAETMAENAGYRLNADVTLSFTGVAGPDASEGHEPGTVYIALQAGSEYSFVESYHFDGGRDKVRKRAVKKGYELLFYYLKMKNN